MDGSLRCVTHIVFSESKSDGKKSFFALIIGAYCNFKTQVLAKVTKKARTLITTNTELIGGNISQA